MGHLIAERFLQWSLRPLCMSSLLSSILSSTMHVLHLVLQTIFIFSPPDIWEFWQHFQEDPKAGMQLHCCTSVTLDYVSLQFIWQHESFRQIQKKGSMFRFVMRSEVHMWTNLSQKCTHIKKLHCKSWQLNFGHKTNLIALVQSEAWYKFARRILSQF